MKHRQILLCILVVANIANSQAAIKELVIVNTILVDDDLSQAVIIGNGELNTIYNDSIFNNQLNCRSGNLQIINTTTSSVMILSYIGSPIDNNNLNITVLPNSQPYPYLSYFNQTNLIINFNCPPQPSITSDNYFNKITILIFGQISFSFKLDCDAKNRHKVFEYGYIIISFIDMFILVGVAMHSYVWSIKINQKPLRVELKWFPFLIFSLVGVLLVAGLSLYASKDMSLAFQTVTYLGIAVSFFFVFLCFNQCFYLSKALKKPVYKFIRICEVISIILAVGITILAVFSQTWILFNILAGCICVGSIKIFHFQSLKQAYISMGIMVATVTIVTSILHFILPRSYNDYATQLSSPLFMMVPDLSENIYKECSWLSITDIIIPGATLSYLRLYDENMGSRYGGIYTIWGNIAFIVSIALWVIIERVWPFGGVPFCLVTYLSIMLVVFIISWRRNDWYTLCYGTFEQGIDMPNENLFISDRQSFSKLLPQAVINDVKKHYPESKDSGSIIQPSSQ